MNNLENTITNDPEINQFVEKNNYADAAHLLLKSQLNEWPQLKDGYESLKFVRFKTFDYDGFKIKFQFNPKRIASSSAKIDAKSIKERKCFLCVENLPPEQKAVLCRKNFLILCNPFPIFPEHFTISNINHIPQSIENSFLDLLHISKDLSGRYTVFYNGPKCGASAPDHLHFQAGTKGYMPIDNEFNFLKDKFGKVLFDKDVKISAVDDKLRKFIAIEGDNIDYINEKFLQLMKILKKDKEEEPMINILSSYEKNYGWRILIFLRAKHRPHQYFEEGEKKVLWSPAAVDLGGICITPLEKDFNNISTTTVNEVFNEIIITEKELHLIENELMKYIN